jgi:hypothetical protein
LPGDKDEIFILEDPSVEWIGAVVVEEDERNDGGDDGDDEGTVAASVEDEEFEQ